MADKHTAGPWRSDGRFIERADRPWDVIAEVKFRRRGDATRDEERRANAQLMAASPEMLRALRAVVADGGTEGPLTAHTRGLVAKAIASATGGEG